MQFSNRVHQSSSVMIPQGPILFLLMCAIAPLLCQDECDDNSCHPQLGDLMVGRSAQLSATSTCGLEGPQNYCILGYLEDEQKCFLCDSSNPFNRYHNRNSHRIENVITAFEGSERKMKWWQSENGIHRVSIKLDLETVFQFSHLVLTFKSFRPAAMLVERSKDFGQTWKVFRYFAEDCQASFPGVSEGPAESLDDVICDTRYSGPEPSTDGEVVLKALDPRFEIDDPYDPQIQELITMTNLRVNFTRLLTLGDTLLIRRRRNPQDKYYYALYEMVVRGSCFCNGHASQCMPVDNARGDVFSEPGMVHGRCVCQHHTFGHNCERCEDFYNDAPWRPAGPIDPHACKKCNCHGHSDKCYFDMARFMASGEVSGGVCEDCRNNRTGTQCEQCKPFFYQDPSKSMEDPEACIPCDCDPAGSLDNGLCDALTGRCVCKENVEGDRCDSCKYAFYGLRQNDPSGCQFCQCNLLGSFITPHPCDQTTGQCFCQHFATGPYCDQCVPGYWGLGNTVYSCLPCDCDIGGSTSSLCSSVDGQCPCRPNMVGLSCSNPAPGHYLAPLDYYIYEAEDAVPLDSSGSSLVNLPSSTGSELPKCQHYFHEQGYDFKLLDGQYVLTKREKRSTRQRRQNQPQYVVPEPGPALQVILRERHPDLPITWTGPGFMRAQQGATLRFTVTNIPASLHYHLVIHYEPESIDDWFATIRIMPSGPLDYGRCQNDPFAEMDLTLSGSRSVAVLDSTVCLEAGVGYSVDVTLRKLSSPDSRSSTYILIDSLGLIPQADSSETQRGNSECSEASELQQYRCVELHALTPLDQCQGIISSLSALIHNGAISCNCNSEGAYRETCAKFGGQCECKPNVIGRCCDSCAPLTYGFGPNGCTPCECDSNGSIAEHCNETTGQCPCRPEVTGRHCDQCLPGHYGFPKCSPCQCNGLADLCDPITGACLECQEYSTGFNCDRCIPGYYGDPVFREPCEPCTCPDVEESGRFFAVSCSKDDDTGSLTCDCLRGHKGARCDSCAPGFYGDLSFPGAYCEECRCNNNTDPQEANACDSVTGICLHCLHNTQGSSCESCKPGYYGDALLQDCKECSCDRRGTEVTLCPLDSPCFCDQETGQCPCRRGVIGSLCDECDDGYWNLDGDSGCQPCRCDPDRSLNNICDKITGQCPCLPEYGGQQCYECAENYFENPHMQCLYCDCNMEGTLRPACDVNTGECRCRPGVMGILCDECAPGHESIFPECPPCHPCSLLWAENVTDVKKAAEKMRTLIPKPGEHKQPAYDLRWKRLQDMQSQLESALNMTENAQLELDAAEDLLSSILKLKDSIDPSAIIVDPSSLLNTEIDNIKREFQKLIEKLRDKTKEVPVTDPKALNDTLEEVRQHYKDFIKDEERVKNAEDKLETSRDLRQKTKLELAKCHAGDWGTLERKVKALNVIKLNEHVCGAPGDADCSTAQCGGALCQTDTQDRKCGGPDCKGSVPVSQNATDTAEKTESDIINLLHKLRDSAIKINEARDMNEGVKDETVKMKQKITDSKIKFEKEKNDTKGLIKKVKDYLTDEMVKPEDIEKMAKAVLAIQLPSTPSEIQTMIQSIRDLLDNFRGFQEDPELEDKAKMAEKLLEQAKHIKNQTMEIDVSDIRKTLTEAEKLQDKVTDGLDVAKTSIGNATDKVKETDRKLENIEPLLNLNATDLLDDTDALKNKTEMNRAQAEEAKAGADAALKNAIDANTDIKEVIDLFNTLKDKSTNQTVNDKIKEHLKNITSEIENLAKDVAKKMKKIEDLENRLQEVIRNKEDKEKVVAELLKDAKDLRDEIADKAYNYAKCTA